MTDITSVTPVQPASFLVTPKGLGRPLSEALIRDSRPASTTWLAAYNVFWSKSKTALLQQTHLLDINQFGIQYSANFSLRAIRNVPMLIITLTPIINGTPATNLRRWQSFMTEARFHQAKKESAL
jgi:hypothetical protein